MTIVDLDTSALSVKDLKELPKGKYVLVVDGILGSRGIFFVDSLSMDRMGNVHGWLGTGKQKIQVACFRGERPWYLVNAQYVEVRPLREFLESGSKSTAEFDAFNAEMMKKYNLKPPEPEQPVLQILRAEGEKPVRSEGTGFYL